MNPWQSFEHTEISSSPSYSNLNGETELAEDLSRIGSMSGNFMDFYRNEDVTYESFDQINSFGYQKPF